MKPQAVVFFGLLCIAVLLIRCGQGGDQSTDSKIDHPTTETAAGGEELAAKYCQSCHQLPQPALLDKTTWKKSVLPVMGLYLGIRQHVTDSILNMQQGDMPYMPQKPVIDSVSWQRIVNYYIENAPERLPVAERVMPVLEMPFFKVLAAPAEWTSTRVLTSYVKIDQSVKPHRLIVADGMTNKLIVLDDKLRTVNSSTMSGAIVDMVFKKDNILTTTLGDDLWANNAKKGNLKEITIERDGKVAITENLILDKLSRPVSATVVDLDQDGSPDYLVNQFGKMVGRLSWFEKKGSGYQEHILRDKPGCVKVIVDDKNPEKVPHIWALFAQGDEGLFRYDNDGKGNFSEHRILSFPPSYGSTYFEFADMDNDGKEDIVYTCGDNGDFSQIPKPYHGIYIYINKGNDNYEQKYFFPFNGCYKAVVKDFDSDGKPDMAAISQFPGNGDRDQTFIFLKVERGLKFKPFTLPKNIRLNNVMTMDVGDIDADGKPDILLGNGFVDPEGDPANKQPLFLVLKNIK